MSVGAWMIVQNAAAAGMMSRRRASGSSGGPEPKWWEGLLVALCILVASIAIASISIWCLSSDYVLCSPLSSECRANHSLASRGVLNARVCGETEMVFASKSFDGTWEVHLYIQSATLRSTGQTPLGAWQGIRKQAVEKGCADPGNP